MGEVTGIGWCHHTFNGWRGCTKVSPACDFCYAEKMSLRWGLGAYEHGVPRRRTSENNWREPLKWDKAAKAAGVRRRCFAHSLSDVFDAEVLEQWRQDLFDLITRTPNLDWLVLTKRHSVAEAWYRKHGVPANVWVGVSVENQQMANARIPYLLRIPARVRFLSVEPMLEPIEVFSVNGPIDVPAGMPSPLHWIIIGGESESIERARPFNMDAGRRLLEQCQAAKVPVFWKQMGTSPMMTHPVDGDFRRYEFSHTKGEDMAEWPSWAQVQEFPEAAMTEKNEPWRS